MMEADRAVTIPEELGNTAQALDNLLQSVLRQGLPESEVPIAAPYRLDDCGWVANPLGRDDAHHRRTQAELAGAGQPCVPPGAGAGRAG
jgi:hypothetical protein